MVYTPCSLGVRNIQTGTGCPVLALQRFRMQKDDLVVDARQVFLKEVMGTQGRIRPLVPGFQDVEELAKGGMMDDESKTKKSRGLFGDMSDVFGALSGGAHIVRREDGTL